MDSLYSVMMTQRLAFWVIRSVLSNCSHFCVPIEVQLWQNHSLFKKLTATCIKFQSTKIRTNQCAFFSRSTHLQEYTALQQMDQKKVHVRLDNLTLAH